MTRKTICPKHEVAFVAISETCPYCVGEPPKLDTSDANVLPTDEPGDPSTWGQWRMSGPARIVRIKLPDGNAPVTPAGKVELVSSLLNPVDDEGNALPPMISKADALRLLELPNIDDFDLAADHYNNEYRPEPKLATFTIGDRVTFVNHGGIGTVKGQWPDAHEYVVQRDGDRCTTMGRYAPGELVLASTTPAQDARMERAVKAEWKKGDRFKHAIETGRVEWTDQKTAMVYMDGDLCSRMVEVRLMERLP